jgi:hypothetical protein
MRPIVFNAEEQTLAAKIIIPIFCKKRISDSLQEI